MTEILRGVSRAGHGDTAQQFGASVDFSVTGGAGLFLAVGRDDFPVGAVASFGGQILVRFPGTAKVLAVLPIEAQFAAQNHPSIALVGPVVIDPKRFAAFAALTKLDEEAAEETG